MPDTFNPFQQWLGLSSRNPHHFQLLGVSTKLTDPAEIQQAVEAGVQRNLDLLSQVAPGKHDALLKQIKQRISIARETLLDEQARSAYLTKLTNRVKPQNSGKAASGPGNQASSKPVKPAVAQTPVTAAKPIGPPVAARSQALPAIPLAVPLNMPQSSANPNSPQIPVVAKAIPTKSNDDSDVAIVSEVKIKSNPRRKRKRSLAGPIFAIVMLIMAGVGAFLIYQNRDALMQLGGVDPKAPIGPGVVKNDDAKNNAPVVGKTDGSKTEGGKTDVDQTEVGSNAGPDPADESEPGPPGKSKLPAFDLDSFPELTETDIANVMDVGDQNPDNMKPGELNPDKLNPDDDSSPEMVDVSEDPVDDPTDKKEVKLDDAQLAKIRRHLQRARRSMYRHNNPAALDSIRTAKEVVQQVRTSNDQIFVLDQQPVVGLVDESYEIVDLLEGFWRQVSNSSQAIRGGQEIVVGEQIVGFLEANAESVTVRNAGSNITYQYYFCPPGLAVELALQGAIPDIPEWSKQLAAFYAINQFDGVDHADKIEELLKVAEDAEHDCKGIRHFATFEFGNIGKPAAKIELPKKGELDKAVAEFRAESNYTDVRKLDQGMAGMHAEFILQIDSPNFEQHVAFLEEARQLAIAGGEASKAEDAVLELDIYAKIEPADLLCESFIEIAKGTLTELQARELMERAITFLKSSSGKSAPLKDRKMLATRLAKIAQSNSMLDAMRRLSQLD